MSVEVIRRLICDWCSEDDTIVEVTTHRLVFDKKAVEVELHLLCADEATISYLMEKGRRPSAAEVINTSKRPAKAIQVICSICGKEINAMGKGRHTSRHQAADKSTPTYKDVA